ncbi:MFS transporter [Streptomyces sp. SCSIO 30461]|uniref:MFS transporter n=1 Tax=Streptomyces sp. SCSIO 30461 TaxID=3118085 RepID=UPI00387E6134
MLFFALPWGAVVWVPPGEIFPGRIRADEFGVATAAQWAANWAITVSFPPLSTWNLTLAYGLYALFATVSLAFVYVRVRETKGRRLERIRYGTAVEVD